MICSPPLLIICVDETVTSWNAHLQGWDLLKALKSSLMHVKVIFQRSMGPAILSFECWTILGRPYGAARPLSDGV